MKNLWWIALGGGLGSLARYGVSTLLPGHPVPYDVVAMNLSGSVLIAVVMTLSLEYGRISEPKRLFTAVGILGGYTTFSTYVLGIYILFTGGSLVLAFAYATGSLILGVAGSWVGALATRRIMQHFQPRAHGTEDDRTPNDEGSSTR